MVRKDEIKYSLMDKINGIMFRGVNVGDTSGLGLSIVNVNVIISTVETTECKSSFSSASGWERRGEAEGSF